jgi:hypothetical protein
MVSHSLTHNSCKQIGQACGNTLIIASWKILVEADVITEYVIAAA